MSLFRTAFYPALILSVTAQVVEAQPAAARQSSSTPAAQDRGALESVLVTARYRREDAQTVPISMSIIGGDALDASHTISLSQLTELVPTLNYSSPNPRNTALTIRGLGSSVVAVAQANVGAVEACLALRMHEHHVYIQARIYQRETGWVNRTRHTIQGHGHASARDADGLGAVTGQEITVERRSVRHPDSQGHGQDEARDTSIKAEIQGGSSGICLSGSNGVRLLTLVLPQGKTLVAGKSPDYVTTGP